MLIPHVTLSFGYFEYIINNFKEEIINYSIASIQWVRHFRWENCSLLLQLPRGAPRVVKIRVLSRVAPDFLHYVVEKAREAPHGGGIPKGTKQSLL